MRRIEATKIHTALRLFLVFVVLIHVATAFLVGPETFFKEYLLLSISGFVSGAVITILSFKMSALHETWFFKNLVFSAGVILLCGILAVANGYYTSALFFIALEAGGALFYMRNI